MCLQGLRSLFNLFIYGCIGSSFLRVGFLQLRRAGATLCCGAWASHCGGFSCCRAQALGARASATVARGLSNCGSRTLEHRLSSCGMRAQLLRGMWDLPGAGIEPVSPALAGGFLTTVPTGKSQRSLFKKLNYDTIFTPREINNNSLVSSNIQSVFKALFKAIYTLHYFDMSLKSLIICNNFLTLHFFLATYLLKKPDHLLVICKMFFVKWQVVLEQHMLSSRNIT